MPYKLKVEYNDTVHALELIDTNPERVRIVSWDRDADIEWLRLDEIKPYMRHLSQLTEEIEYNGERFVPVDVIFKEQKYVKVSDYLSDFTKDIASHSLSYSAMQMLIKWHFDIDSLLEKGLAIPIPSLK